jgi:hypothetical protein
MKCLPVSANAHIPWRPHPNFYQFQKAMFFNSTSNRIKGTLVFFLVVTAVASFTYTHYLVEKIREKSTPELSLWARALEYNSKPLYRIRATNSRPS